MRRALFALIVPLALACDDTEGTGPIVPVSSATVSMTAAFRFLPATVQLLDEGTVTWQFNSIGHNVTFNSTAGAPANIPTQFGGSVARTFTTPGTYAYHCTIHGTGMSGTIVVHEVP
jgi:plastocyanin